MVALTDLMREFDDFESSSPALPLWPRIPEVNRETRNVEISLPDDTWSIFDGVAQAWSEAMQRITVEMLLG
jgi:hypothetical protein